MKMTAWTSLLCAGDFHFSWRADEKMDYIFGTAGRLSALIDRHVSAGHSHPGPHLGPAPLWGVNLTLVAFLVTYSFFLLIYGPLSDRFGRRYVLKAGISIS